MKKPIDWIGWDVETTGEQEQQQALMPWSDHSHLISYAHARWVDGATKGSASADPFSVSKFLQDCIDNDRPVIGWNTVFDVAWLIKMGHLDLVKQIKWLDGMLLWKAMDRVPESDKIAAKRKSYGLKSAVEEFLPEYAGYADDIEFVVNQKPDRKLLKYNYRDAAFTLMLGKLFWDRLMQENPRGLKVALLECACIPMVAEHHVNGLVVDVKAANELRSLISNQIEELGIELESYGITEQIASSPAQLSRLLYKDWGLPVKAHTPKGAPSANKEALFELSFLDHRVAAIEKHRELKNLRTKFVDKVLESVAYNGGNTTHPTMRLASTYTGRATFSSFIGRNKDKRQTGFAIHQMKRAAEYRRLIKPPPGFTLVEWDAAGQEYRWMAVMSGDRTMLKLCMPGEDPHSYMGAQMSAFDYRDLIVLAKEGDPEAKPVRQAGKVGNLSCQYRIGVAKLLSTARVQHGMDWVLADAQRVSNTYHRTYPGVRRYWKRQIRLSQNLGYVETIAGRRVYLRGNWSGKDKWQLESTAVNFPIQGVGADQKYLAMASLRKLLDYYNGSFFFELHDGLYSVFPDEVALEAAHEGKRILDNLPYERVWGFKPPIPLPWDIKIGPNWGDSVELSL